ncbi:hypothetical protein ABW19_dt0201060 [Dactylella cylindrospora]|nr:hypothetical protein ABW19_dt0201060 [Dactylella cylindrospora]
MSQSSLTPITTPPDPTSIPTLAAHQSSTPATFTAEVLHYHTANAKLSLSSDQKFLLPGWFPDATDNDISLDVENGSVTNSATSNKEEPVDDDNEDWEDEDAGPVVQDVHIDDVTVMITTKSLTLYSPSHSSGYVIQYPSISLHAITSTPTTSGIYMQINTHSQLSTFDDHDYSVLELTVYPPQTTITTSAESSVTSSTKEMFDALTDCGNLWPDTKPGFFGGDGDAEEDGGDDGGVIYFDHNQLGGAGSGITFIGGADEVGGIPALAPGGWITAENVDKIQWNIGGESGVGDPNNAALGPGAGSVRRREDGSEGEPVETGANGETDPSETKWRRTE